MRFEPRSCPRPDCPSRSSGHHRWCFKGGFTRACDGRTVQRFLCLECQRTFWTERFRVEYRIKKPKMNDRLFMAFIYKVTNRKEVSVIGCLSESVENRLKFLGRYCRS